MKVSKVVLQKENQVLVLQGMTHMAPGDFYAAVQREMDVYVSQGYKIFCEGIHGSYDIGKNPSKNEKRVAEFLKARFEVAPVLADALKINLQEKNIKLPKETINADISFKEYVDLVAKKVFKHGILLSCLTNEDIRYCMGSGVSVFYGKKPSLIKRFLARLAFVKMMPITLDWRDKVAVDKVESFNFQKSVVYYGDLHIPGIVALLEKRGWKVISRTKSEVFNFKQM